MTAPVSLFVCPPASPSVASTGRRFGKRSYSADDLVRHGSLPPEVLPEARAVLPAWRNVLVSGGTASGKTTLLNALIELLPEDERIVSIEDTLELRMDWSNCVRFEARGIDSGSVTIRDLGVESGRGRNPTLRVCPMPFDDVGDSIFADAEVAGDPTIALPAVDGMKHLRGEPV